MPSTPRAGPRAGSREITAPIELCRLDGTLNPAAVGWTRHPLHTSNITGRGRTKRWEYWCIQTPDLVLSLTVSDLDYAALSSVWFLDVRNPSGPRASVETSLLPLRRVSMPQVCGAGPVQVRDSRLLIALTPVGQGVRLRAITGDLDADVIVRRPAGHEALGVVVPWSSRRFQYTVKENTLPAEGQVVAGGRTFAVEGPDAWATLDHGRGRWPYRVVWNWGAGSGRVQHQGRERVLGIQVGGAWTDGSGSTENALTVDGVLHPVHEDLVWRYDRSDWLAPWQVRARSGRLDLEFRPDYERRDMTQLGVLSNETHQCFGTWHGRVVDGDGDLLQIDGVRGWAEEVRNRW
jgi:hypothetical protein